MTDIVVEYKKTKIERLIDFVNDVDMKMFGSGETKKKRIRPPSWSGHTFHEFFLITDRTVEIIAFITECEIAEAFYNIKVTAQNIC